MKVVMRSVLSLTLLLAGGVSSASAQDAINIADLVIAVRKGLVDAQQREAQANLVPMFLVKPTSHSKMFATSGAVFSFFNFLPDCIGTTDRRYADGTTQQIERGQGRVKRLVGTYRPHKTLVFTHKGWREFPSTVRRPQEERVCYLHRNSGVFLGVPMMLAALL